MSSLDIAVSDEIGERMGGMNRTPSGERVHIAFFGRRNVGKSSLMNAFTGQELSVVSQTPGTTTDAVYKAMELLPLGPVVLIDTPGLDDTGELGEKRVQKAAQVMRKTDIAIVVADGTVPLDETERELIAELERREIPWLLVYNKEDLADELREDAKAYFTEEFSEDAKADCIEKVPGVAKVGRTEKLLEGAKTGRKEKVPEGAKVGCMEKVPEGVKAGCTEKLSEKTLRVSAATGYHIRELKERVATMLPGSDAERPLIGDLLPAGDTVVLVVPLDAGAPKGRLILPQQQVIRGILEAGAFAFVCRDTELEAALGKLASPPRLVVTDSQVFDKVNHIVPASVPLTSFSILMARYKGDLNLLAEGAMAVKGLKDGDRVLICEGCTHHRQCEDIGTVKLPGMIRRYMMSGTKPDHRISGGDEGSQGLQCEGGQNVCGQAEIGSPEFSFVSGTEFPTDVSSYKLVVHCGGCMLNKREMRYRLERCRKQGVPVTNYGVLIAYLNGILERALGIFRYEDESRLQSSKQ